MHALASVTWVHNNVIIYVMATYGPVPWPNTQFKNLYFVITCDILVIQQGFKTYCVRPKEIY